MVMAPTIRMAAKQDDNGPGTGVGFVAPEKVDLSKYPAPSRALTEGKVFVLRRMFFSIFRPSLHAKPWVF